MSIECEDEGGIEYLDEILVFSEGNFCYAVSCIVFSNLFILEANIDDDFMEFSKEILSIEEYDPWYEIRRLADVA